MEKSRPFGPRKNKANFKKAKSRKLIVALLLAAAVLLGAVPEVLAEGKEAYGPRRVGLQILAGRDHVQVGSGGIWNSRTNMLIQLDPADGWRIKSYKVDLGPNPSVVDEDGNVVNSYSPPLTPTGNPKIGHFDYKEDFELPYLNEAEEGSAAYRRTLVLNLSEDMAFQWGAPWEPERKQGIAIFLDLVKLDGDMHVIGQTGAWAVPELITWIVEEEETEDGDVETEVEVNDDVVADVDTGEIVAVDATEVKDTAKGKVHKESHQSAQRSWVVDEAEEIVAFDGGRWGWWFTYELAHPKSGHFIDSPVEGLSVETPTYEGITVEGGKFDYFPGERVDISIGSIPIGTAIADHKISPLDIFEAADTEDEEVINMAVLLQSLDADGEPKKGITITEEIAGWLSQAMGENDPVIETLDFTNDAQIDALVAAVIEKSKDDEGNTDMAVVSREDAKANLDRSIDTTMFRKNVSRTPDMASAKAKLNIMGVWFPALRANGELATFPDGTDEEENPIYVNGIPYYDADGELIRTATEAKPIVVIYCDEVETGAHDVFASISRDDGHTWKRKNISRMADRSSFTLADGVTEYYGHCKKPVFQVKGNKILVAWTSKFARGGKPRYSIEPFDLVLDENGDPVQVLDENDDPVFDENGDPVLETEENPYYADDIWGVSGPQRSVDYTDQGFPEVGEVPYSALWVARAVILTASDLTKAPWNATSTVDGSSLYSVGDIVWFKPERLTSGRRDANQNFCAGADGAGFAVTWQEDPEGLRPGEAKGPGPGWGGATTNHKTDIWYSYVTWGDFAKVDTDFVAGGDPEHYDVDFIGRPKALVPMSLPVRVSDNDVVNTHNMWIELDLNGLPLLDNDGNFIPMLNPDTESEDSDGSHRYGYMLEGLWNWDGNMYRVNDPVDWEEGNGGTLYEFTNQQGELKRVVVTADGRALDGNTGASRSNLFLQTYTKPDGTKSAWAIMAYEETKGVGLGPPEDGDTEEEDGDTEEGEEPQDGSGYDPYETFPDEGKNAIYHSFDFRNPDLVSAGTILNLPESDGELIGEGDPVYVAEVPYLGSTYNDTTGEYDPIPNPAAGELILDWKGDSILAYENARRPRFILQSKAAATAKPEYSGTVLICLYKEGEEGAGRPSDIMARRCVAKGTIGNPYAPENFVPGAQNVSTVTPLETWINPDRDPDAKGDGVKVCKWEQPVENLALKSGMNPYEDARAHRGQIRGDFVIMGYSITPNWAASRKAHDKYDFYLRRSFDGGATWTTDPESTETVVHTDIYIDPDGVSGAELPTIDEEGNDITEATKHYEVITEYAGGGVYEPGKNVSLIKNNKTSVIEPRIVAVPGTIKVDGVWTGIDEDKQDPRVFYLAYGTSTNLPDVEKAPEDLFFSFSMDKGTTMMEEEREVNPDSSGNFPGETVTGWYRLAKGAHEQGEVQLRMTPDGSRFYACWLDEGEEGSDIVLRRVTDAAFPANVAETTDTSETTETTEPETTETSETTEASVDEP